MPQVVEEAELTAAAAREVGAEAAEAAGQLQEAADGAWWKSMSAGTQLAEVARRLQEAELQLLEVELENEALRAQLVTSGIEPQVEWWKDELAGLHGGGGPAPLASPDRYQPAPPALSAEAAEGAAAAPPRAMSPYQVAGQGAFQTGDYVTSPNRVWPLGGGGRGGGGSGGLSGMSGKPAPQPPGDEQIRAMGNAIEKWKTHM